MGSRRDFSEETGREIDEEVHRVILEAEKLAVDTLTANRDVLERVAKRLMDVELIDADEFRELVGDEAQPSDGGAGDGGAGDGGAGDDGPGDDEPGDDEPGDDAGVGAEESAK
jgi:hypothetical protein